MGIWVLLPFSLFILPSAIPHSIITSLANHIESCLMFLIFFFKSSFLLHVNTSFRLFAWAKAGKRTSLPCLVASVYLLFLLVLLLLWFHHCCGPPTLYLCMLTCYKVALLLSACMLEATLCTSVLNILVAALGYKRKVNKIQKEKSSQNKILCSTF